MLYTTLPHALIKNQLADLIRLNIRLGVKKFFILPAMKKNFFSLPRNIKTYSLWTCQRVTEALVYLLDNIHIRFGSKLYRKNVGIPFRN